MNKICLRELNSQLKECGIGLNRDTIECTSLVGVHHRHEWDHGYESGMGFNGPRRMFYADMYVMINFLNDYFKLTNIDKVVLAPFYRYNQFDNRYYTMKKQLPGIDIFDEIRMFLKTYGIKKGERAGIEIPLGGRNDTIAMIIEGGFRGISELCLFSFKRKVLIVPNHHFDLAFFTHDVEKERATIHLLLKNLSNLEYYEKCPY